MCLQESCFLDCLKVSSVVPVFNNVGESFVGKCTTLLVFSLLLVKSLENLEVKVLLITLRNVAFYLISGGVLDLDQLQTILLFYLLTVLLINLRLLIGFGILFFLPNSDFIVFQVRCLALFCLRVVLDG